MKKVLFAIILLVSFNLSSQEFQGQAFYKTQTAMDFGSWGDRMSAEQKKNMKERMKPFLEPVYILTFDKTKSIYKQEERLDAPGSGGGRNWGRMMSSAGGPIYKDVVSKKSLQSTEFMGKKFLVSNNQDNTKWVMQKEQKMIGNYLCFKATAQIQKPKTMTSVWRNSEKESKKSNDKETDKTSVDTQTNTKTEKLDEVVINAEIETITAWYTPQIPVSHGPAEYGGLPGLILELTTESTVMLCTKVIMNPEKRIEISAPTKGEFVTKNEFENIVEVKVKEMRDMWRGGRSKSIRKN
ncbi:MAG: ribonuclease Z [Flavobacteriaceae bacterium]|nr:ribonuclease Z [Flavobacteriaceae bacterium]